MSPEAQQIAIAKVCGWKHIHYSTGGMGRLIGQSPAGGSGWPVPNYLGSLDAMQYAEESLSPGELAEYSERLRVLLGAQGACFDSAAVRAELFLRIKDKWEEDK